MIIKELSFSFVLSKDVLAILALSFPSKANGKGAKFLNVKNS